MNTKQWGRTTLRQTVKDYIIDQIFQEEFKPGNRLIETKISKTLSISQGTVREALRELEQIGIIEYVPFKGVYLKKLSTNDLIVMYSIRAELEGLAMQTAVDRMNEDDIKGLKEIYFKMLDAGYSNNHQLQITLDNEFHRCIVKASGMDLLIKTWETMCIPYWTFLGTQLFKTRKKDLVPRHYPIVEAIESRDKILAVELIRDHFYELRNEIQHH